MASNLPTISVTGSYGSQGKDPSSLFSPGTTVYALSAGFSFPLSAFSRGADETAAARARADQARAAYENQGRAPSRDPAPAAVRAVERPGRDPGSQGVPGPGQRRDGRRRGDVVAAHPARAGVVLGEPGARLRPGGAGRRRHPPPVLRAAHA